MKENKHIFKAGLAFSLILSTSLFANSDNLSKNTNNVITKTTFPEVIAISKKSKAGKEIFKNQKLFLEDLKNNQAKNRTLIYLVNQIQKDRNDINTLKLVIAKLINQTNKQKIIINQNQQIINNLNKKIKIQSSNINDSNIMLEKLKNRLYRYKQIKQGNPTNLVDSINTTKLVLFKTKSVSVKKNLKENENN